MRLRANAPGTTGREVAQPLHAQSPSSATVGSEPFGDGVKEDYARWVFLEQFDQAAAVFFDQRVDASGVSCFEKRADLGFCSDKFGGTH